MMKQKGQWDYNLSDVYVYLNELKASVDLRWA